MTSPAEQMREACARVAEDLAIDMRLEADRDGHGATLRAIHQATAYTAERLAAAIRALPAPDEWQGIESIPSRTPVLALRVDQSGQGYGLITGVSTRIFGEGGDWVINEWAGKGCRCSHWRPLPAAPSPEGSGDA